MNAKYKTGKKNKKKIGISLTACLIIFSITFILAFCGFNAKMVKHQRAKKVPVAVADFQSAPLQHSKNKELGDINIVVKRQDMHQKERQKQKAIKERLEAEQQKENLFDSLFSKVFQTNRNTKEAKSKMSLKNDVKIIPITEDRMSFKKTKGAMSIVVADVYDKNIDSVLYHLKGYEKIALAINQDSPKAMKKAVDAGFQVFVNVPMEPFNSKIKTYKNQLMVNKSASKNIKSLNDIIDSSYQPVGIITYMGSKFTDKKHISSLEPVVKNLKKKDLFVIDTRSNPKSIMGKVAKAYGVPYISSYMFLSAVNKQEESVFFALDQLKSRSEKKVSSLGVGNYSATFIKALKKWLKENKVELARPTCLMGFGPM